VARALGGRRIGKPYQVAGVWYVPAEQPDYDAVGTASWYGDAFHGRPTANGEAFDMTLASAAHPTLPLPSIVEVTNLENDRSVQLRVNDRGPFKPGRIIDVSRQAAEELGFRQKGVAQVRVRYVGPAPLDPFLPMPGRPQTILAAASAAEPAAAVVAMLKPAAASRPEPLPTLVTVGAPVTAPGYAVQAGAFANRSNAERAAKALGVIAPAQIVERAGEAGSLYRVLVGAWPEQGAAAAAIAAVAAAGFPDARVVSGS
jgi:rare lipoprotein A